MRIGIWAAMLTAGTAVVIWGLGAEKASDDALARAQRDAPVEMIVGGAIGLPSKSAQAWHDWNETGDGEAADAWARTPADPGRTAGHREVRQHAAEPR